MIYILIGFILLLTGAEIFIRGAVGLAEKLRFSKLIIGLTVVAFGTSAPELFVSIDAALKESTGIAIGNVVGSNIVNILLILGISAVLFPLSSPRKTFQSNTLYLLAMTSFFSIFSFFNAFDRWLGLLMLTFFTAYLVMTYRLSKNQKDHFLIQEEQEFSGLKSQNWATIFFFSVGGLLLLILGSHLLVSGALDMAYAYGISEAIIGVTIVAIGTSLPELATSALAALKRQNDIAIGNILGSNIFNMLMILGVVLTIYPSDVPIQIQRLDHWVMLIATFLLSFFIFIQQKISRLSGILFLILYGVYIAVQILIANNIIHF